MPPHEHTTTAAPPGDSDQPGSRPAPPLSRRAVLRASAAATVGFAGCSALSGLTGRDCEYATDPAAIALTGTKRCEECGMVVERHPGPVGQIFYCDNEPRTHANPAWFDALNPCLFDYQFAKADRGWEPTAVYVTDYSTVDYEVYGDGGRRFISSHVSRDAFADARELTYVVDSEVEGAMGPAFVPFSVTADAEAFAAEYGGERLGFDEITPAAVQG